MKTIYCCLILCLTLANTPSVIAQSFSRLDSGDIVNNTSDSRSVNIADLNGDGWEDVFISNGLSGGQRDLLYFNDQNGNFTSATSSSIVEDIQPSVGASLADFDNDGDVDVYVTNWYGRLNKMYENDGSGNFTNLSNATVSTSTYAETATWADCDSDGLLDIFITNSDGTSKANLLYKNTKTVGFEKQDGMPWSSLQNISRNANWIDYDNDNDLDLYVTNEGNQKNELFANDGMGNFTIISENILINQAFATMTSSWGDIDNDGDLDLFLGNAGYFSEKANALFRNLGNGQFEHITDGDAANANGCNYGSSFGDIDNDGDLDLLITSAFCDAGKLEDVLYLNDGNGLFQTATNVLPGEQNRASYGAAIGDLNQDGFLDIVIAHCKNNSGDPMPENAVYYNDKNDNHWLRIKLEGTLSNRSAVGARIQIYYQLDGNSQFQMREVNTQSGYSGQNSSIAHFGLGAASSVDSIRVNWPSGLYTVLETQTADQLIAIEEEFDSAIEDGAIYDDPGIQIFPNPISPKDTQLTVEFKEPIPLLCSLRRQDGQEVFRQILTGDSNLQQIALEEQVLSTGIYYLVFYSENRIVTAKKLVVE